VTGLKLLDFFRGYNYNGKAVFKFFEGNWGGKKNFDD